MARGEITLQIKGLDEIKKRLAKLPAEISQKVLDKSVRAGVVEWQKTAQQKAPQHDQVHVTGRKGRRFVVTPGNLKRSIRVKKMKSAKFALSQESRYGIVISNRAFYWRWIEFGSRNSVRQSFLRSTFDNMATASINQIAADCQKFIERYFAKGKV